MQLHIRSDNGNAEAKNQTIMKWAAWMTMRDSTSAFQSVTVGQFRPGHAHFRVDQRFSQSSRVMSQHSETIQDPEDVKDVLMKGLGKDTDVEYITGMYDWKKFFEPWQAMFHGHTQNKHQTERGERAVHVFKFVQRRRINPDIFVNSEFHDFPEDARDCVLLTKAFLASTELSQTPTVCVPFAMMALLEGDAPLHVTQHNKLSTVTRDEFRKTAEKLEKKPYELHKTVAYLNKLMSENRIDIEVPDISWVQRPVRDEVVIIDDSNAVNALSLDFDVRVPAMVRVENKKSQGKKRSAPRVALASTRPDLPAEDAPQLLHAREEEKKRRTKLKPLPDDMRGVSVGCCKCRKSPTGCRECRLKVGMIMLDGGDWVWPAGEPEEPGGQWRRAVRRRPAAAVEPRQQADAPVAEEQDEDDSLEEMGGS